MSTQANVQSGQDDAAERSNLDKSIDRAFIWTSRIFALAVAGVLIWIAAQTGLDSIPAIREFGWQFWVTETWDPVDEIYGALPMIYGTLVSSAIALLLAVPLGVGSAIF